MGRKGEKTRRLIREKALQLFIQKGFNGVTMKDVCLAAGLSRGGLYRHYDSTRQIFLEIMETLMAAQDHELSEKMNGKVPAPIILDEILSRYRIEMTDANGAMSMAILEFYSEYRSECGENLLFKQYLTARKQWKELMAYGVERGEFKAEGGEEIIDILLFSYQGVRMLSPAMPVPGEIPERITSHIRQALLP